MDLKDKVALVTGAARRIGAAIAIQLHQAGIENVVASSGTALTPDQIHNQFIDEIFSK